MSNVRIVQLMGMTYYEFRMHWRRRGLVILMWAILVVVGLSILIAGDSFRELSASQADAAISRKIVTSALILTTFSSIGVGLVFVLPIVAAETIPLDRQYGVRELLDTMPISPTIYLLGKLLGLWLAVLSAMGLVMVVTGVIWWFKAGAFNIGDYAEVWLVGIGSIVVLNGSLGVLIPAAQATRMRAIIVTLIGVAILTGLFGGDMDGSNLRAMASPVRGAILNYYLFSSAQPMNAVSPTIHVPTFQNVLLTIGVGLVEVIVLFGVARLWIGWQDSRQ